MSSSEAADAADDAACAGPNAHGVLALVLPLLPPDAWQCAAATCRPWRAAVAAAPDRWRVLDFRGCAVAVDDATLSTLCGRAGAALRELRLDAPACAGVTVDGIVEALRANGCVGLRRFTPPSQLAGGPAPRVLEAKQALALGQACPALVHAACRVACAHLLEANLVPKALPGPLTLVFGRLDDIHRVVEDSRLVELDAAVAALELPAAWWQAGGAVAIGHLLGVNKSSGVRSLDFSCNQIEDAGARSVADMLLTNKKLTNLNLATNWIGQVGAAALADALRVNSTLTKLSLTDNRMFDVGAAAVAAALHANTSLKELQLGSNGSGDAGAAAFAEALRANSTLTSLELDSNGITPVGAALLSEALAVNRALTQLGLANNPIEDAGAISIGHALRCNCTLHTLHLSDCSIGDAGVVELSEALRTNATLKTLNLAMNDIALVGATALAQALSANTALTSLDLSNNRGIKDAGALELADALRINSTLRSLDLSRCHIDDLGATVLGQALAGNYTLTSLNLSYNLVTDVGGAAVIDAWARDDATLLRLDLRNNKHSAAGAEALLVQAPADGSWAEPIELRPRLFSSDGAARVRDAEEDAAE